jgi:predicted P-loop ATPase
MKISEFDKTAKTEVSTLKDIITAPSTNLRAPYDKDSKLRLSRCSFISSANAENLLRDSTGNRRFLIFEIDSIEYAYSGWSKDKIKEWQGQCLAEMKHLAELDYKASAASWLQMREYIEKQTPGDLADEIAGQFVARIRKDLQYSGTRDELSFDETGVIELITAIARESGLKPRTVKSLIQARLGVFKRVGIKRFWKIKLPDDSAGALELLEAEDREQELPF